MVTWCDILLTRCDILQCDSVVTWWCDTILLAVWHCADGVTFYLQCDIAWLDATFYVHCNSVMTWCDILLPCDSVVTYVTFYLQCDNVVTWCDILLTVWHCRDLMWHFTCRVTLSWLDVTFYLPCDTVVTWCDIPLAVWQCRHSMLYWLLCIF